MGRTGDQHGSDKADQGWHHAAPFALLAGDPAAVAADGLAARLRRMGFRPEPAAPDLAAAIEGSPLRLAFGALRVLAGPPSVAMRAASGPDAFGVTTAGPKPATDWAERALAFVPEPAVRAVGEAAPAAQRYFDRRFFEMLVLLIDTFDADYLYWSPAQLWSRADLFRTAVIEMLDSGMPPVLHLVAFVAAREAGEPVVETRGLRHFTGQEIVASPPPDMAHRDVVRRLARLALDMLINGPVDKERRFAGLDAGEALIARPEILAGDDGTSVLRISWRFDGN